MKKKGKRLDEIEENLKKDFQKEDFDNLAKQLEFFEIDVEKIKITLQVLRASLRKNKEFRRLFSALLIDLSNGKVTKKEFVKSVELHTRKNIDANLFEKAYLFCSQHDEEFKLVWWVNSRKLITFSIRADRFAELMLEELLKSLEKLSIKGLVTKKGAK